MLYTQKDQYQIDFTKIKTIEDVCKILEGFDLMVTEDYHKFEIMKPYLKKVIK